MTAAIPPAVNPPPQGARDRAARSARDRSLHQARARPQAPGNGPAGRSARPASASAARARKSAGAAAPKATAKKTAAAAPPGGPGAVRIIGGQWKRTLLPVASRPGLRPTPGRLRETLFNWLGQDLSGWRCVDAFAGSGALGFEAASRGAAAVQLVECDAALAAQLQALQQRLQAGAVQVLHGDGIAALQRLAPGSVDLVLLDPPFDSALYGRALQAAARAVCAHGFVYLEAARAWSAAQLAPCGLVLARHLKAGAVHAHLLRLHAGGD